MSAARVAKTFHQDPVMLLDDPDDFRWAVRIAAYNVIAADQKAADKKSSSSSGARVAGRKH